MHNDRLSALVGNLTNKSATFSDLVEVQSVHPGIVTSNLNNFTVSPDAVTADDCAAGSLASFGSQKKTMGAIKHTIMMNTILPLLEPFPVVKKMLGKEFLKDPNVVIPVTK
jgi:hypothetical protein